MLVLLGCNHKSAPVAMRERIAFPADDVAAAVGRLLKREPIREACLLSTCNRLELLVRTDGSAEDALESLREFLVHERGVAPGELSAHTYHVTGDDAVRHLFEVACGIDSMILGEPQILGQVKRAFSDARRGGGARKVLERLFQQCLTTAKRVRTESGIARHAVSVGYAAAKLAKQIFGDLSGNRVLVLGAGKMAELVTRHLVAQGVTDVFVTSRPYNRAAESAARFDGEAVPWDQFAGRLGEIDIVIGCTGSTRPVLTRDHVSGAMRARRGRPLFLIDLAVPRDVDPDVDRIDNVYRYDIDGLQQIVDSSLDERRRAAEDAKSAIDRDVLAFARWRREQDLTPSIVAMRRGFEQLGLAHVDRYARKLGPLSPEQERELRQMVVGLMHKIVHGPVSRLRRSAGDGESERLLELLEQLFDFGSLHPPRDSHETETTEQTGTNGDTGQQEEPTRRRGGIRGIVRGGRDN